MKDRLGTIVENIEIALGIFKMIIHFEDFDEPILGGQFIHILLNNKEHVLRRPFCICDYSKEEKTIEISYAVVGDGTKCLSEMRTFEQLHAIFPLGNGFTIPKEYKKVVLLGGGMGSAVLPAIPKANADKIFFTYLGFANKDKVILEDKMRKLSDKITIATDDGTYGRSGYITNILKNEIKAINPDCIFCCGPEIMYKVIKKEYASFDIPIFVSLEQRMGCGIGACLVCNCKVKKDGEEDYVRVCKDGPVFKLDEVVI